MKKATLLTFLFAVLMIALLVSCNTTPDPLSDETTTDGAAEEPTDATSDEAEVSDPVETTTEEVTTEALSTETTMKMPEWVIETDGIGLSVPPRMYLAQITEEGETTDSAQEPIQIPETATPWHITEWEPGISLVTGNQVEWVIVPAVPHRKIPEEKKNLAIKLPETGEYICENFKLRVETFQEYYRLSAPVQIRCTVELQNADLMRFRISDYMMTFHRTDSSESRNIETYYLGYGAAKKRRYTSAIYGKDEVYFVGVSAGAFPEDVIAHDIEENGICVFEHILFADSDFFEVDAEGSYYLKIALIEYTTGYVEFEGEMYDFRNYIVKIPIEVVEVEYVDP